MPIAFLLAMQAAGMVVDYIGTQNQIRLAKMGADVEQAGIEMNIENSRLQTEESSLDAMKKLRQNLGSQAALFAARGTRLSAGSASLFGTESVGNFNADERMRKINQLSNEANLKAGKTLSQLHEASYENNAWKSFASRSFNTLSTNPNVYKKIGGSFGLTDAGA